MSQGGINMKKRVLTVVAIVVGVIVLGLSIHLVRHTDWNAVIEGIQKMHGG
jgi:hypothetical protein